MKKATLCLLFCLSLALSSTVSAAELKDPGLITDRTVTAVGHDFYRGFTDRWEKTYPETITISERPSARWGSWISIKIGQDTLYQTLLFPNRRNFNKEIDTAVASVLDALSRRQIDKALLSTGDLTGDEF
ncbi:curli production assembly/transport protein CsgE [Ewingella americana]|jgi:curli production assembly/transport component CsgE|uniref:Curli production assembly/transport component CsgE n=1 Tax=Ewingella americana TaxID=41202 RepID=A0A502GMD6_9GAMM|nr:curli production assembly/transport protein CsgE [Ewingella americana]TPG63329.1 curli production assembly/transport protein CsgE [Ewingella americana]